MSEIIITLLGASRALAEWSFRKYPDASREDAYLPMLLSCQGILKQAALRGEVHCIAWPLWWAVPPEFTVGEDGGFADGAGICVSELVRWLRTFDADAKAWEPADWWRNLYPDGQGGEQEAGGKKIIGFAEVPHGEKGRWFKDNVPALIRRALEAGTPARRDEIIRFIKRQPEAGKDVSKSTLMRHVTNSKISAEESSMKTGKT